MARAEPEAKLRLRLLGRPEAALSQTSPDWLRITQLHRAGSWREGIDTRTGRSVRVAEPGSHFPNDPMAPRSIDDLRRGRGWLWIDRRADVRRSRAAEVARDFRSAAFCRVLAIEPVLVVESPPGGDERPASASEGYDALLQLLEALAEMHAAGYAHRRVSSFDIGLERDAGTLRTRITFPSVGSDPAAPYARDDTPFSIGADLAAARALALRWMLHVPGEHEAFQRTLDVTAGCASAVTLARAVASRVGAAPGWERRIEAMADVRELPIPATDWDRVIAVLERDLASLGPDRERHRPYFTLQLAAALDQRARFALARCEGEPALADAERAVALDGDRAYRVTRAVARLERGDVDGAMRDADAALEPIPEVTRRRGEILVIEGPLPTLLDPLLAARAHLVRARVHAARGESERARAEGERARALSSEPIVEVVARSVDPH
jgi:hypothetical protein